MSSVIIAVFRGFRGGTVKREGNWVKEMVVFLCFSKREGIFKKRVF